MPAYLLAKETCLPADGLASGMRIVHRQGCALVETSGQRSAVAQKMRAGSGTAWRSETRRRCAGPEPLFGGLMGWYTLLVAVLCYLEGFSVARWHRVSCCTGFDREGVDVSTTLFDSVFCVIVWGEKSEASIVR